MKKTNILKVLFTWKPPRGLERFKSAAGHLDIQVADDPEQIVRKVADAEVLCVGHFNAAILKAAKKLRWVHAYSGGVNGLLFPKYVASPIPMTCFKGCFDTPAAEYALAVMLAWNRKLESDIRQRPRRKFVESEPRELKGRTVGIIGLGSMGLAVAKKCKCFEMRVIGLSRRAHKCPSVVDEIVTLPRLLEESDFVVVAVPLTPQTEGLIGAAQLRAMKPTAYLVDVSGRPAIYDTKALVRALKERWIAGANLQMVPPADSPLWKLDNLLLAFHRIVSKEQYDRCIERFCENLRRYQDGKPLLGLVDKAAGY
jgi:phosphoglycerate dehydrogenase-like enzyme